MQIDFPLHRGRFVERPNRFVVVVRLEETGALVRAHCPNPGRMHELLLPEAVVYLSQAQDPNRRTPYTLRFIEHPAHGQLISLNTQLPNDLFAEGLSIGFFPQFDPYPDVRREVRIPHPAGNGVVSRIDFRLSHPQGGVCWVETKSVTLVHEDGLAEFPDAPTLRGRRHLEELAALAQQGDRSVVVFIVQRPDARLLRANRATDPAFAAALEQAVAQGVEVYAYTCRVTLQAVTLEREIPVDVRAGREDGARNADDHVTSTHHGETRHDKGN